MHSKTLLWRHHYGAISCLVTLSPKQGKFFIPEILELEQTVWNFPGKVSTKLSDFPTTLEHSENGV